MSPEAKLHKIGLILGEIASNSSAIERFGVLLEDSEDRRDIDAYLQAIRTLANVNGLLADRGCELGKSWPAIKGSDMDNWLMPPAYFDKDKQP